MTNFKITDLIIVAQNFIQKYGIDYDKSGTINSQRELALLLSGTGASSIDELDIHNINTESSASYIEIFSDENSKLRNEKFHEAADKLENMYNAISHEFENIFWDTQNIYELFLSAKQPDLTGASFGENSRKVWDSEFKNNLNNFIERIKTIKETISNTIGDSLDSSFDEHLSNIQHRLEELNNEYNYKMEHSIHDGINENNVLRDYVNKHIDVVDKIKEDIAKLRSSYKDYAKKDVGELRKFAEGNHTFGVPYHQADGSIVAVLRGLDKYIDNSNNSSTPGANDNPSDFFSSTPKERALYFYEVTSPITRNYIKKIAKESMLTGISPNNATQNIKRSSYKTSDEIYTLRENNVIVSDYSGKVVRTETLDPEKHKQFFE